MAALPERPCWVNCVAYQDGRKLADISRDEVSAYVERPECFVWVALKEPDAAELGALERQFALHPLAVEDARHGHQRPKLEEYGDSLFVVLHTIELESDQLRTGEVDVFVGRNYVLSVRSHAKEGFMAVRARCERQPELLRRGSGFVLYEAVGKLCGGRVPAVAADTQEYFRDVSDHLQRILGAIESLRDMVTTAMNVNLSLISLQENETTKRLAAYAALVAVPTLIAGLYGMNFQEMPGLRWVFGFPITIAVMISVDVWLFKRFRRARWL